MEQNYQRKKSLIIYHGPNCIDGFTAAWAASQALSSTNAHLYPMNYGDEQAGELIDFLDRVAFGGEHYHFIYILDFSLTPDVLAKVVELTAPGDTQFVMLDHHKTAFEMYQPGIEVTPTTAISFYLHDSRVYVHLNNKQSGAGIAWDYFHPRDDMPALVSYVQDRDLWKYEIPNTKAIHKYLAHQPKDLRLWTEIAQKLDTTSGHTVIVERGRELLDIYNEEVAQIADEAQGCRIKGHNGLMVECDGKYASDVGHILAQQSGTYGMTFFEHSDGETLQVSLRSEGDYDVETLAKKFGGGGHKNAAGFTVTVEEIMEAAYRVGINLESGEMQ